MSMDTEYIVHQDETKQRIQTVAQHAVQTAVCAGNSQYRSGRKYVFKKGGTFHVR